MFFTSSLFWMLMGMIAILAGYGFKLFAEGRGWVLNWWKWILTIIWYIIFCLSFYAWGTLIGENEAGAGLRTWLLGMFISLVLGVGLWRLLLIGKKSDEAPPAVETPEAVEA